MATLVLFAKTLNEVKNKHLTPHREIKNSIYDKQLTYPLEKVTSLS